MAILSLFAIALWIWTSQFQPWTTDVSSTQKDPRDCLVIVLIPFYKMKIEAHLHELFVRSQW